jgi:FixJ family two-component response regulator
MQAAKDHSENNPIVFVIDDEADVRDGLQALLGSVGLRSMTFASAAEFLRRGPPTEAGCLILDVRLPGLGGLDFQAHLVSEKIGTPIIFITGHGDIPMTVKAMKAGALEFLIKPLREQDLLDAVRIALDKDLARWENDRKTHDLRVKFHALSGREQQIMALVTAGLMNKQIAAEIALSEVTVKVHRHNIMKKLGARSLADLVRIFDLLGISRRQASPDTL